MKQHDRWEHLVALDDELLKGGVILSEWCSFIVREADTAFVGEAHLASILTAVSGIETYLRSEYSKTGKERLVDLINQSQIPEKLKENLHTLRKYRNKWVHVDEPWDDASLLDRPEETEKELEDMALFAVRALRETIYENQWV
jgi:adenylosuccinate synthase